MSEKVKAKRRRRGRPGRISQKHQVTIPIADLEAAGLEPGDAVEFVLTGPGRIEIRRPTSRFDNVGTIPGFSEEFDIDALRDEWER
ncbi:bifunctional DNA-binding transcriptional regulator/antitoxin component of YhaV-PrlF toxin-antitoxin module [Lipingzhangella halophila]|uniref:Bifunctional DNA-binding transcriptional regulator/antitoxin component of YhaV-PrlF toxin-antitoxin module n=1 Tax=Lipingzhangella halophila TaxID=1783352 RepID=A0A7W7W5B0_9ACTN|nr:AbrB/MazE/SpoVT family DNA-binding domain-containing protein [Lipingzhangella halophila]MBB4935082.1 bifunctional DNA-binding transcriptional regulator/antitoxin component of YhaV-PrlF toxin-antitoxin module [Lipingzhangella halophila]